MTLAPTPEVKAAVETVEAAKDWLAGEVTRRRNASGRAVKIQGVVGHEAAANHLSTILTALSQATEENERLRDECCKLADTGLTQAQRATKAEAETDEALERERMQADTLKIIHDAAFKVRHAFGGRMSEVSQVFEHIVRVAANPTRARSAQGGEHG